MKKIICIKLYIFSCMNPMQAPPPALPTLNQEQKQQTEHTILDSVQAFILKIRDYNTLIRREISAHIVHIERNHEFLLQTPTGITAQALKQTIGMQIHNIENAGRSIYLELMEMLSEIEAEFNHVPSGISQTAVIAKLNDLYDKVEALPYKITSTFTFSHTPLKATLPYNKRDLPDDQKATEEERIKTVFSDKQKTLQQLKIQKALETHAGKLHPLVNRLCEVLNKLILEAQPAADVALKPSNHTLPTVVQQGRGASLPPSFTTLDPVAQSPNRTVASHTPAPALVEQKREEQPGKGAFRRNTPTPTSRGRGALGHASPVDSKPQRSTSLPPVSHKSKPNTTTLPSKNTNRF